MRRYIVAYAAWLAGVLTAAAVAAWWYKHVEQIGLDELGRRVSQNGRPTVPERETVGRPDA